jgi:hypothetical protein
MGICSPNIAIDCNVPHCYTIESSMCGPPGYDKQRGIHSYYDEEGYEELGRGMLRAINDYIPLLARGNLSWLAQVAVALGEG